MKLWQTRRHWEKFARTDPMWSVLTVPDKAGNKWSTEEFFATGREGVAAEIKGVRARYPALRGGHALDFGCGMGRLTQGLAPHFERVTGLDISEAMLELARGHNRFGDKVRYLHNDRPDLSCFADGTFDFVYSVITLQHVAPEYSRRYIAEFLRVLAPGGVALFQIPARAPIDPGPANKTGSFSLWPPTVYTRVRRRIRRGWRRAMRSLNRVTAGTPVMEMHPVPREEVLAILQANGGDVLNVYRYDAAGTEIESYGYLVRKP
jgi:SAM-dependent methyltransferase